MTYVPIPPPDERPQHHDPVRPLQALMRPSNAGPPPERDLPPAPPSSPAHLHRVERYLHLGFTETDAQTMACAKDHDGFFVYWVDVGAKLDAGCTHAQAVAIYA